MNKTIMQLAILTQIICLTACGTEPKNTINVKDISEQIIGIWDIHKKDTTNEFVFRFYKAGKVILVTSNYEKIAIGEIIREEGIYACTKNGIEITINNQYILQSKDTNDLSRTTTGWSYDQERKEQASRTFTIPTITINDYHGQLFFKFNNKLYRKISSDPNEP